MKKNKGLIFASLMILLVLSGLAFWYFSTIWFDNSDYPYYGHMIGGWGMPFGMIIMGLFWILVIYFSFNGLRFRDDHHHDHTMNTLNSRLAKGEITMDEYEELIKKIEAHS